jgi:DNA-binding transcriptional regulator YdaS (Cro superfamily)
MNIKEYHEDNNKSINMGRNKLDGDKRIGSSSAEVRRQVHWQFVGRSQAAGSLAVRRQKSGGSLIGSSSAEVRRQVDWQFVGRSQAAG